MQIADVGRNEPCPCGSGRKYKKCCLEAQQAAAGSSGTDRDIVALVDLAVAEDHWDAVLDLFEQGFALFEPTEPLEHVRFRDDLISATAPDRAELSRLCGGSWIRRCEREICYVLDRYELEERPRDGLRLAVHLLRRFGAQSPLVEALAKLQAAERGVRVRSYGDLVAKRGLTADAVGAGWADLLDWIERERPTILPFADWFALWVASDDEAEVLWQTGIASRVCDICLDLLEQPDLPDAREHLQLAGTALICAVPRLGAALAHLTSPRMTTDDERRVHAALTTSEPQDRTRGAIERIADATEARGDFAGAALLREARQRVQARRR